MIWRDASGRTLADYPHPSTAVDVALLTVQDGRLQVLLHERPDGTRALPGTFVRLDETLAAAALRALRDKVGVTGERPEQLRVFDDPTRDDRGRVLSVAHVDLVPRPRLGDGGLLLAHVGGHGPLAFDHAAIVEAAVAWARGLYASRPDPRGLAGEVFTLLELQRVHAAVAGTAPAKDTFRRKMIDRLADTGRLSTGGVGKPARLYTRLTIAPSGAPTSQPVGHLAARRRAAR